MSLDLMAPPALISEVLAERPSRASDPITEMCQAYRLGFFTGDEREAMLCAIERFRDELEGPAYLGPQRARMSQKSKRRLLRAIDVVIREGRAAA